VLIIYIAVFILGSLWGSFSNVCIYRLPEKGNVVSARSKCRNCQKKISWFDNIPFISYIILRGKCRNCGFKISFQYFVVELLVALGFLISFHFFGFSIATLLLFILTIFFVIIFFIDLKHFIIPNELTFPLMAIGFLKSFDPNLNQYLFPNYINSLIGGVVGYLIIWFIIFAYKKLRNKEGMGLGDAKLLSAMGFWFGWISIPFILFFSSFVALGFAIPSLVNKSKTMSSQIPFGPYLVLGCVLYLVLIEQIIKYLN
jgi:leader peptidase (prepilin peptidase)/N-methyltransferase